MLLHEEIAKKINERLPQVSLLHQTANRGAYKVVLLGEKERYEIEHDGEKFFVDDTIEPMPPTHPPLRCSIGCSLEDVSQSVDFVAQRMAHRMALAMDQEFIINAMLRDAPVDASLAQNDSDLGELHGWGSRMIYVPPAVEQTWIYKHGRYGGGPEVRGFWPLDQKWKTVSISHNGVATFEHDPVVVRVAYNRSRGGLDVTGFSAEIHNFRAHVDPKTIKVVNLDGEKPRDWWEMNSRRT